MRHTVLVKLTQEDDVACLHKQVYQRQGHKVFFMKVHRIELLPDVLDDVHGKVRLVSSPKLDRGMKYLPQLVFNSNLDSV